MPSLLTRAVEKVAGSDKARKGSSPDGNPEDRVIPPEPVQINTTGADSQEDDAGPGLQTHNVARASKGLKKLQWDAELAHEAAKYASKLAHEGTLEHSGVEDAGENLYKSSDAATFADAVESWLGEQQIYNGGEKIGEGGTKDCLHFTQCLWHNTSYVGMGSAQSEDGATYVVARYKPRGNISGEKPF